MNSTERKAFYEAKQKKFESSFQSKVWTFDGTKNAEQSRILRARFLLSSEKNSDGTPRAKARLIAQGFRDPDAFGGSLSTASPTLTRLSRNFILAIAAMQNFQLSQRTLLPRPSCREVNVQKILTESFHGKLMKLTKPMYRLCDAPRAWFEEATEKLEYCGNKIQKIDTDHWKLCHEKYLAKQKPISITRERTGTELPVTEAERTQLRGLLGALTLTWPATQSSPHLQAMISMLSGEVTEMTDNEDFGRCKQTSKVRKGQC